MLGQVVPLAVPVTGGAALTTEGAATIRSGLLRVARALPAVRRHAAHRRRQLRRLLAARPRGSTGPVRGGPGRAARRDHARPDHAQDGRHLARLRPHLPPGVLYGYRVHGPFAPRTGHRFNPRAILLDPYARALSGGHPWGARSEARNRPARLGKVVASTTSTGKATSPRRRRCPRRSSTRCTSAASPATPPPNVQHPGTFLGLCEKIPYLKALGVTAVQLMPILEFDELDLPLKHPVTGETLRNYWGYSPLSFFAPKAAYASQARPAGARVQGDGQAVAQGRHRGHPRRGVQPHLRGQRERPDAQFPRPGQLHLLHAGQGRPLLTIFRAAATRSTATTRWCAT